MAPNDTDEINKMLKGERTFNRAQRRKKPPTDNIFTKATHKIKKTQNEILAEEKVKKIKKFADKIIGYCDLTIDHTRISNIKNSLKWDIMVFKSQEIDGRCKNYSSFLDKFFLDLLVYGFDSKQNIEKLKQKLYDEI